MKFEDLKNGDLIRGRCERGIPYNITNKEMTLGRVEVFEGYFKVKVIEHQVKEHIGAICDIPAGRARLFEKVEVEKRIRVGDCIRGTNSRYTITNRNMHKAVVTRIDKVYITIKALEHSDSRQIGKSFDIPMDNDFFKDFEIIEIPPDEQAKEIYRQLIGEKDYTSAQVALEIMKIFGVVMEE